MGKIKVILCGSVWLCCFVVVVFGTGELEQSVNSNAGANAAETLELSRVLERLDAQEKEIGELKGSRDELKSEVTSLKQEIVQLKQRISQDDGIWLLTPPLRGPQGRQGDQGPTGPKGEIGLIGQDGKPGEKGEKGPKGDRGFSGLRSISSCSVAKDIFPSSRLPPKQWIYPEGNDREVEVLCDFDRDGGRWTIIQKRSSGPRDQFDRTWSEYAEGFGSLDGNFWLGLENIRALTKNGDQELRIDMEDFNGTTKYAKYSNFSVADATDFYRLSISGYSGNAGDDMNNHNGMKFGTKDKEISDSNTCAASFSSGWWFANCYWANLNGLYLQQGETVQFGKGIRWNSWTTPNYSLAKTVMQIRTKT